MGLETIENFFNTIERIADAYKWEYQQVDEERLDVLIQGKWTDYHVSFALHEPDQVGVAYAFDFVAVPLMQNKVRELIALINIRLVCGHFSLWEEDRLVMLRNSVVLSLIASEDMRRRCEQILMGGIATCERYFPAFQFVTWAGKSPKDAFDAVSFETKGEG